MKILTVREYEPHVLESSLQLENGQLNVRSDTQHLFAFRFRNGSLEIQPQGHVGLIPLNSVLAIDVQPRINIDLARLLSVSGAAPAILPDVIRNYSTSGDRLPSLLRLYAESLERAILQIVERGFINRYERVEELTSSVSGRILVDRTLRQATASGQDHVAAVCRFEKLRDTDMNNLLVEAVLSLKESSEREIGVVSSADRTAILKALNHCLLRLAPAAPLKRKRFVDRYWHDGILRFSPAQSHYQNAISISRAILEGCGIAFDHSDGTLEMRAIVINTAAAFEAYVRKILTDSTGTHPSQIDILDGNRDYSSGGGKRPLFDNDSSRAVTPDIVCRDARDPSRFPLIIDVKYKPIRSGLDRSDLNQILVYAIRYHSPKVLVVHPSPDSGRSGLTKIGTLRGISVFRYAIDMSTPAIVDQEVAFAERILRLCRE